MVSVVAIILSGLLLYVGVCKLMGYPLLGDRPTMKFRRPNITGHEGEILRPFNLILPDSIGRVNVKSSEKKEPVVIFYFEPNCPFCQAEVKEITKEMSHLADIRFFLITHHTASEIREFCKNFKLDKFKNITVGMDEGLMFMKHFSVQAVPFITVYNKDSKISAVFIGNVKHDQIRYTAFN